MDKQANMEYIEREFKDLDEDIQFKFGQLVHQASRDYVTKCSDGSRIYLNKLPTELIQTLFNFVKNQIEISRK